MDEKYRLLLEGMLNGYALCEAICNAEGKPVDFRILEVNRSFETMTRLSRDDALGKTVLEVLPRTESVWLERLGGVALTGRPDQFESYSTNLKRWFKVGAYSPQRGQFVATFSDITGRKVAEQALSESEEHARQIFNQSDDAVILFKMDTFEIIDANPAALQLYRVTWQEFKGLKPWAFISPADFRKIIKAFPAGQQSGSLSLDRATNFRKDGSAFEASIRAKVMVLRNEYVILCNVRDITEKLRLEEEMKATQAKLIQTNKMTSLGMLVSGIAHEINNPNNFISVNAAMLCDTWKDAAEILKEHRAVNGEFQLAGLPFSEMELVAPRLFSGILEGAGRIARIVSNMREFVKNGDTGKQGDIDLNHTIENAVSLLWHHIHRSTDCFGLDLAERLPTVRGNAQQLEQVVINLVMNALQALPDKESGVMVKSALAPDAGSVEVTVTDEGSGMSRRVREHLTEPFFSTRIDQGGTGLGLYISSSIIKEHSGTLSFESAPGKGTTVTIRLPRNPP